MRTEGLYLGGNVDPAGERTGDLVHLDPDELTTHGVIVGMTGSGKTGLGIIYIEELLRRGIPTLVLDPKGDMTNLLLTFPDLAPADFEPWIDEAEARREGRTPAQQAEAVADLWRNGLSSWDLGSGDIGALRQGAGFTIYTPGSGSGVSINLIGSLSHPGSVWKRNAEFLRDEISGLVSGLLGLAGIEADPISSREHVLLASLIEHAWRNDIALDMAVLLGWIQKPPMRKLGVFDIESFFPADDRREVAFALNAVVASPSFSGWATGVPLDVDRLLWTLDRRPRAAILYLAHLSDAERQFAVAAALSRMVGWMRTQPGSSTLRALVYIDEAFGFAPPVGEPPAKKPLLTILKQARAFGVGMLVATQNPMDLDYKAMSNAGTWNIGRLQTERDKARILEGLASASGGTDVSEVDRLISGLGKRRFLLHRTRHDRPTLFTTRWAMSYLRGPLTVPEIGRLVSPDEKPDVEVAPAVVPAAAAEDETTVAPIVADGINVRFADPAAPWAGTVGIRADSHRYAPALAATVSVLYDEAKAHVTHRETWEAIFPDPGDPLDGASGIEVDHDPRDFEDTPAEGATFTLPEAPLGSKSYFRTAAAAIRDHITRTESIEIYRNRALRLYSRVAESRGDFVERCERAADEAADAEAEKLRDKYETRLSRARDQFEAAERRADEIRVDLEGAKRTEWTDLAGGVIDFLTGRRSARRAGGAARRRAAVRSKEQRLRSATEKIEDRRDAIEQLERELDEDLDGIADKWDEAAADIEAVTVGVERTDVSVDELFVVWIPR